MGDACVPPSGARAPPYQNPDRGSEHTVSRDEFWDINSRLHPHRSRESLRVRRQGNIHIGDDPPAVRWSAHDLSAGRRDPCRSRELQRRAVRQNKKTLNGGFAQRSRPDNDGPAVVLERPSDDLRPGGSVPVHDHRERQLGVSGLALGRPRSLSRLGTPRCPEDDFATAEEQPTDRDDLALKASGTATKVEDQPFHTTLLQTRDRVVQLCSRVLVKLEDCYVPD